MRRLNFPSISCARNPGVSLLHDKAAHAPVVVLRPNHFHVRNRRVADPALAARSKRNDRRRVWRGFPFRRDLSRARVLSARNNPRVRPTPVPAASARVAPGDAEGMDRVYGERALHRRQ